MRRTLATIAATAAVLALFARNQTDLHRLAKAIATEEDHVTQEELAKMTDAKLIDVRSKAEFAKRHVANAENVPIETIASAAFDATKPIVLLSDGGAHAAQAWVILQLRGFRNVYFLKNGTAGGRRYEPGRDGC